MYIPEKYIDKLIKNSIIIYVDIIINLNIGEKIMLAKHWKKIALLITIIAIIFNITSKLVRKVSFEKEVNSTLDYVKVVDNEEDKK